MLTLKSIPGLTLAFKREWKRCAFRIDVRVVRLGWCENPFPRLRSDQEGILGPAQIHEPSPERKRRVRSAFGSNIPRACAWGSDWQPFRWNWLVRESLLAPILSGNPFPCLRKDREGILGPAQYVGSRAQRPLRSMRMTNNLARGRPRGAALRARAHGESTDALWWSDDRVHDRRGLVNHLTKNLAMMIVSP